MAKRDVQVWTRFLDTRGADFEAFAYDVALGGVTLLTPELSDADRVGWQYNTALKIDAVGRRAGAVWIIEVKPEATVSALGAAVAYTLVARREAIFPDPLTAAIVCEYCQPDVRWACRELGIEVIELPG